LNIAIDYDDTYSADPGTFSKVISTFNRYGHKCYLVTARFDNVDEHIPEQHTAHVQGVFYTDRKAKIPVMEAAGIKIDIWVDDKPEFIHQDHTDITYRASNVKAMLKEHGHELKPSYVLWVYKNGNVVAASTAWPDKDPDYVRIGIVSNYTTNLPHVGIQTVEALTDE